MMMPAAPREAPGDRAAIRLHPRIGGEGDLVERGHELVDEDLREEQPFRIEAEHVRVEAAAGDEHVGLVLHEPEDVADQHGAAEAQHRAGARPAEARPDHQRPSDPSSSARVPNSASGASTSVHTPSPASAQAGAVIAPASAPTMQIGAALRAEIDRRG